MPSDIRHNTERSPRGVVGDGRADVEVGEDLGMLNVSGQTATSRYLKTYSRPVRHRVSSLRPCVVGWKENIPDGERALVVHREGTGRGCGRDGEGDNR